MKPGTIEELMIFFSTSMLDLEEQKANESEAAREEKDKNPHEIEVEPILDTEQDDESGNPIVTLMYD
jgi:hypothetical protein